MSDGPVDARRLRFEQAVSALLLLAGFVFGWDWVLPVLALVLVAGALLGSRANVLHRVFDVALAPRLRPPTELESADEARFAALFGVALLGSATVLWAVGLGGLAWLVALVYAVAAAVAATTGASVGRELYDRLRGGRQGR